MVMQDEVKINGTDITQYRTRWKVTKDWKVAIDGGALTVSSSISDVLTPAIGDTVTIKRGFTTATDEFLFEGQITQKKPGAATNVFVLKGKLYDAIKNGQTKTWDKDIDTEAGVGSEIFKSICDNSLLSYDSSSITSTGTDESVKIVKFVQNDEDDFQKMNELAELYKYTITYDYEDGLVNFKPQGFTEYPHTLVVGTAIPGQIDWKDNMEDLINKVKILGATVYDKLVKTEAGPTDEVTLDKTPEDTEVRHDHAGADTLLRRGVKDVGIFGTDYDYYVDVDTKKVVLSTNYSDIWIRYGAQVPMPVVLRDQNSIDTYGGPNKIPHFKRFTFDNLKDIKDAEDKGRAILNKYSSPFVTAEKVPISDTTIQTYGNILPGALVTINDQTFNQKTETVFVNRVEYSWPHITDKITVGDKIWRTEDWQVTQMEKTERLLAGLNKNQDIIITLLDISKNIVITKSPLQVIRYKLCDTFKLDHYENGLLDQGEILDNMTTGSAANWSGTNFTVTDTSEQEIQETGSVKLVWAGGADTGYLASTNNYGDISEFTGATSGSPTKGTIGLWVYVSTATDITNITLRIGSSDSNYTEVGAKAYASVIGYSNWSDLTFTMQTGWNYLLFDLDGGTETGAPDWENCDYTRLEFALAGDTTFYMDYFTVSKSNYIGLNGLGERLMEVE